jgi:predicted RNA-binding protein
MCESNAYQKKGETEELVLKDVSRVTFPEEGVVELENIFGEEKRIAARLREINFIEHKIIFE